MEQEIEVIKEELEQEIVIQEENIGVIPDGTKEIIENGLYNIEKYKNAGVNVPQPSGTINIVSNGDNQDVSNYAIANVNVPNNITNLQNKCRECKWQVLPNFIFGNQVLNISYLYSNCNVVQEIDTSGFNTSNITNMEYAFQGCLSLTSFNGSGLKETKASKMRNAFSSLGTLTSLDLKDFYSSSTNIDARQLFYNCRLLTFIDIRSFDFTKISSYSAMFLDIPQDCLIIVKDTTQKEWITSKFSTLTNVKTVEEYENSLNS